MSKPGKLSDCFYLFFPDIAFFFFLFRPFSFDSIKQLRKEGVGEKSGEMSWSWGGWGEWGLMDEHCVGSA